MTQYDIITLFLSQVAVAAAWQDGSETDNEASDTDSARAALPRVVGLGLRAVFDMIKETETSHPLICQRGLKSLLDVLQVKSNIYFFIVSYFCFQGLLPEDLKDEPEAVMEAMFTSLLDLASRPGNPISINGNVEEGTLIQYRFYSFNWFCYRRSHPGSSLLLPPLAVSVQRLHGAPAEDHRGHADVTQKLRRGAGRHAR